MGGVRQGVFVLVPIIFLSQIISIALASLPLLLGMIENATIANLYFLEALNLNVTVFLPMLFITLPGVVVGGLLVGG